MKNIHYRLKHKLNEVFLIEPVDLGPNFLTLLYKKITNPLKYWPFVYIIPLSLLISLSLYLIFGPLLLKLVTLLQYGF